MIVWGCRGSWRGLSKLVVKLRDERNTASEEHDSRVRLIDANERLYAFNLLRKKLAFKSSNKQKVFRNNESQNTMFAFNLL